MVGRGKEEIASEGKGRGGKEGMPQNKT